MATLPKLDATITVGPMEMVANSLDIYTTSDGHFATVTAVDDGDWYYAYPEPQKSEVTVHYDLHYDAPKKEVKDMRSLYHVVVVNYKTDEILEDGLVIAENAEKARIKAAAPFVNGYDLDDLDVICNKLGDVRKKKEVQKVQVVKE